MRSPNFFIIGAPKCGTTALSFYLQAHPDIYFSPIKEPRYFSDDFSNEFRVFTSEKEYLEKCFGQVTTNQTAVGEGSVHYIYSRTAINNIMEFNPNAKIIIMLRNPVEMIYSYYYQMVLAGYENEKTFRSAWYKSELRAKGRSIPKGCPDPKLINYELIGKLYEPVRRVMMRVPADQIKIIWFEEFKKDTSFIYQDLLKFLGAPQWVPSSFPKIHQNRTHRFFWLTKLYGRDSLIYRFFDKFKRIVNIGDFGIYRKMKKWNMTPSKRPPLDEDLKRQLYKTFDNDIKKLSKLTNKDLTHWTPAQKHKL